MLGETTTGEMDWGLASASGPEQQTAPAAAPDEVDRVWYAVLGGVQVGPMDLAEVERQWQDREIDSATLLWRPGMQDWISLADTPETAAWAAAKAQGPEASATTQLVGGTPREIVWRASTAKDLATLVEEEFGLANLASVEIAQSPQENSGASLGLPGFGGVDLFAGAEEQTQVPVAPTSQMVATVPVAIPPLGGGNAGAMPTLGGGTDNFFQPFGQPSAAAMHHWTLSNIHVPPQVARRWPWFLAIVLIGFGALTAGGLAVALALDVDFRTVLKGVRESVAPVKPDAPLPKDGAAPEKAVADVAPGPATKAAIPTGPSEKTATAEVASKKASPVRTVSTKRSHRKTRVEQPAPKTEPAEPPPAQAESGPPLGVRDIVAGVKKNASTLMPCLRRARNKGELLPGRYKFILDFRILPDGSIANPRLKGPTKVLNTSLATCLPRGMKGWKFPSSTKGAPVKNFPFGPLTVK